MLTCGACGSGVCAQEKYKNLKDGSIAKYIYYGCTKARDINCKEGYIEEKILIQELLGIIDKIDLDKSGIKKKLEVEIERHKKFHSGIMGKPKEEYSAKDADISAAIDQGAAYVFVRNGSVWTQLQKLIPSDGNSSNNFGQSVAISGNFIVIGSAGTSNSGKGYIFHRNLTVWNEKYHMSPSDLNPNDFCGKSVSIAGNFASMGRKKNSIHYYLNQKSGWVLITIQI